MFGMKAAGMTSKLDNIYITLLSFNQEDILSIKIYVYLANNPKDGN